MSDDEDERTLELDALTAIYPELTMTGPHSGSLCINIDLPHPISVHPSGDAAPIEIKHLPPVLFTFDLPVGYPETTPPTIMLDAVWISPEECRTKHIPGLMQLWQEAHEPVIYTMIDWITANGFEHFVTDEVTRTDPALLLNHDARSVQQEFERESFLCQICQYRKKGAVCTRLDCSHVYCTDCLEAYYTALITQGYIDQVKCAEPTCGKLVESSQLRALVGDELYERYKALTKKFALEADPSTLICPRDSCQALIRPRNKEEMLCICSECRFAFCRKCQRSWHGYYTKCNNRLTPEVIVAYIDDEPQGERVRLEMIFGRGFMARVAREYIVDKEFEEYKATMNIQSCPECDTPIERSSGCNKMTCTKCRTPFCFLCGESLVGYAGNGYEHFNDPYSLCYRQLFTDTEIEEAAQ
jgi:E3 ubiquitin-protein ligase RNF14